MIQRELIFDTTIPERPEPRVWDSVYDIPPGTVCTNAMDRDLVYITRRGEGWWIGPNEPLETAVRRAEEDGSGWSPEGARRFAPFTEVLR